MSFDVEELNEGRVLVHHPFGGRKEISDTDLSEREITAKTIGGIEILKSVERILLDLIADAPELEYRVLPRFSLRSPSNFASKRDYKSYLDNIKGISQKLTALSADLDEFSPIQSLLGGPIRAGHYFEFDEKLKTLSEFDSGMRFGMMFSAARAVEKAGPKDFLSAYLKAISINVLKEHDSLEEAERRFWDVPFRSPDPYARSITLGVARLYASAFLKIPTFGTNDAYASTDFSRAVVDCFSQLGITTGFRGPCEWAIKQVSQGYVDEKTNQFLERKKNGKRVVRMVDDELMALRSGLKNSQEFKTIDQDYEITFPKGPTKKG